MRKPTCALAAIIVTALATAVRAEDRTPTAALPVSGIVTGSLAPTVATANPLPPPPLPAQRPATPLNEAVSTVPVSIETEPGSFYAGDMVVTHMRPDGPGPFPAIVMSHGRDPETRDEPARFRYIALAKYWLRRGFAVFVPTRIGYGDSGTEVDPEDAGTCADPNYRRPMRVMVDQIAATVAFARRQSWVDGDHVLLVGQSYGGFGTIAALGRDIPGVIGAVNFAGGAGGNADARPGRPCMPERLAQLYGEAGRTAKQPALWLYAMNDRYWGSRWPAKWHQSYAAGGAPSDFVELDPVGEDGHVMLRTGFAAWRPRVDAFLTRLGFAPPHSDAAPQATNYAPLDDTERVPFISAAVRSTDYRRFLGADLPRAFAIAHNGSWAWSSGDGATDDAMKMCEDYAKAACALYAVDDAVVWPATGAMTAQAKKATRGPTRMTSLRAQPTSSSPRTGGATTQTTTVAPPR